MTIDLATLIHRMERLEATVNLLARESCGSRKGRIRCVFLIYRASAWATMRDIVDEMLASHDFEPIVVSLPHCYPLLQKLGDEESVHAMLVAQGYAHVRILDGEADNALQHVKALAPAVIFRQSPWDNDAPACLSTTNLSFARQCYVPYGWLNIKMEKWQCDQPLHRLAWRIFCPDESQQKLFVEHNLFNGINCRITGYPKFDHLARHRGSPGRWPIAQSTGHGNFRLIWAPHWTTNTRWLRLGAFEMMSEAMIDLARSQPHLQIVLRPHPILSEAMLAGRMYADFMASWKALANTAFDTEQDYADLFAASDGLLTDGASFLSEYQLFDKPLVFFERPDIAGFNDAGQRLLPGLYRVHEFARIRELLDDFRNGREDEAIVSERRRISRALRPFPDRAARNIVEVMRREWNDA